MAARKRQDAALQGKKTDPLPLPVRRIEAKQDTLHELNLTLEKLRVLWRIIHGRQFISQQQLLFVITQIDEIGRMTGGWIRSLERRQG